MILIEERSQYGASVSYEWYDEKTHLHMAIKGVRFATIEEAIDKAEAAGYVLDNVLVLKPHQYGGLPLHKLFDSKGKAAPEGVFTSKRDAYKAAVSFQQSKQSPQPKRGNRAEA